MGGTDYWLWIVGSAGLVTFVLAAFLAIFQQDLKGILAYSTISHLGLITLLLGLDTPLAVVAAIFHMMNHATFKASLFMAAGIIDHETGTRDIRRLSGLYQFMPITATLAMVAAAAMAGVPLLNGFLSKEMFFAETIATHDGSMVDDALPYLATLAGMFSVAYSLRFIRDVFFGPPPWDCPADRRNRRTGCAFRLSFWLWPALSSASSRASRSVRFCTWLSLLCWGETPEYSLAVWHGFTLPLLMSVIALAGGVTLYAVLRTYLPGGATLPVLHRLKGKRIVGRAVDASASWLVNLLGTSRLQPQLRLLVGVAILAGLWPLYGQGLVL